MEIAKLGIEIDASAIKEATEALNEFAIAAERAAVAFAALPEGVKVVAGAVGADEGAWSIAEVMKQTRERGDQIRENIARGSRRGGFKL